ncbi:hypothetical protein NFI96_027092 [Prochilodus magdalenae]|nr:hypothetical protein NFI96_027092 [Prochilodus magdalenae]
MAVCALSWTLTLLVCAGVCLGQDLVLPARLNRAVGESVVFDPVRIPPPPFSTFTWNTKGIPIVTAVGDAVAVAPAYKDRVSVDVSTLALELRDLRTDDSGVFTLSVTGDTAVYTADTALEVFEFLHSPVEQCCTSDKILTPPLLFPPEPVSSVTITQNPLHLEENSTVRLTCSASGSSPSFSWLNGSSEVTVGGRVQLTDGNRTLTITGVSRDDSGPYTCVASNAVSRDTSLPVTLTVYCESITTYLCSLYSVSSGISGARITGPADLLLEGSSASLTCDANGTISTTEWMKDGQTLSPSNNIIFSADNRSVMIRSVNRTDRGEYRCTIRNPISSGSAVYSMTVNYGPDTVRMDGPDQVEEGGAVTFRCGTESVPEPIYTWEFNRTQTGGTTDSLTVEQVTFTHSGNYTCTARNTITGREASAFRILEVKGPLSAPLCKEEQEEHCQSPTAVTVSDQTIRNRPHEGGLRARRPVGGPVLTGQHRRARLAFATEHQNWQIRHRRLVLFTDESRVYLSTCDRRDRLWRRHGECYAACNIIQHDWFGGGSVMFWGGISLEGRIDLYRPDHGTLTAIRHQDEILGPAVRPYAGAVGPGFLLVHNNARPHVARACRQFLENEGTDTIDWPTGSPDLNPIEPLGHYVSVHPTPPGCTSD